MLANCGGDRDSIECVHPKEAFKIIQKFFFEVGILGIPPHAYGGAKNHQHLGLHGLIKIIVSYTQKDMIIINLKIIIMMIYV